MGVVHSYISRPSEKAEEASEIITANFLSCGLVADIATSSLCIA
jgi:hypothetical protein